MAAFSLATAFEFGRNTSERLVSRWPAVVFLIATAIGYLAWLPLSVRMPIHEAGLVFASTWMPWVIVVATLERIALAFVVLALVKEREELKQRIDALTDPLTGLPNRRALFAAAERLREHSKYLKGDPISVLVFDLDHFKKINDTFGHRFGDRVLQLFAHTMSERLETGSIVGRLGGEEFAAILPGADLATAGGAAEQIRTAFAGAAESYLNVGRGEVLDRVRESWASFWLARGIEYRARQGIRQSELKPAVLLQAMADAEAAGVIFTVNPVTGREEIVINASFGLGETVVSGRGEGDLYTLDGKSGEETAFPLIGSKKTMIVRRSGENGTLETAVPMRRQRERCLTAEMTARLARIAGALEEYFGYPLDIEFAVAGGRIAILQAPRQKFASKLYRT
jgi:diguanylate cyclase (GGDEF)-like protein